MEKTQTNPYGSQKLNVPPEKEVSIGYITFSSSDEATTLCKKLLLKKLIACANIRHEHKALYTWKDQVEESTEVSALIKTRTDHIPLIESFLQKEHSYDTPCFVASKADYSSPKFRQWVIEATEAD